ncbi:ArsR/SmtB family transcription factor [Paeniglutamicibacter gangotriensis]|uniref:Helix-turn-helix domain protein n=2 Tax=Paeniglutamicibacter gangotriensis TaxID=254787 RepID=M7MVF0_9MICC|nr:winged helix-turn-helix domain-containing protein [Paeniglutamicibacter gangotriensis]EMQ98895.1 Helix-turn-helix domain protein [Paeniglutamicibacter gangotriensis Lz1y]KAA0973603.1 helix-turn-helix transcriptional regulator [Paeniglutamicibacter gangotriensis]
MTQNTSPRPVADGPGMAPAPPQPVSISDPQAIRALAHEARLTVLEELFASQATRTATELATRCALTPSAMSYHLRALEKYGYVVRAASEGDGRERRWKAAGSSLVLGSLTDSTSAKNAYLNVQLNAFRDRLSAEIARRDKERKDGKEPPADRAPVLTTGVVFLSEPQRKEFITRVYDLLYEYEELAEPEARGVDGERLYYMLSFLPEIRETKGL